MGNITNPEQHESDTKQLQALAELCPVYQRHLSHHLRNSLTGMTGSAELLARDLEEGNYEAVKNHLARLTMACEHMRDDLTEAGL